VVGWVPKSSVPKGTPEVAVEPLTTQELDRVRVTLTVPVVVAARAE